MLQAIQRLGHTCGLTNLLDSVKELRTKSLDSFTPKMRNLRGMELGVYRVQKALLMTNAFVYIICIVIMTITFWVQRLINLSYKRYGKF